MNLETITDTILRELLLVLGSEPGKTAVFHTILESGGPGLLLRVLRLSDELPDEHAYTLISMGLSDVSEEVRKEARRQGIQRWPERDPDQME